MTMNEISSFIDGIKDPTHAPGLQLDDAQMAQLTHNAVLGHGMAVQAIRSVAQAGTQIGLAEHVISVVPVVETNGSH